MSESEQFPYQVENNGAWVYPHRVKGSPEANGTRAVVIGRKHVGYVRNIGSGREYIGYDEHKNAVVTVHKRFRAANFVASRDFARQIWLSEAKAGAFGHTAQRWAHAVSGGVIDNVHEDLPQVTIEHSTVRSGSGDFRQAVIKVDGEYVGLLVGDTYGGNDGEDIEFFALDAQGNERGKSTTLYNAAVGKLLVYLGIPSHYQPNPNALDLFGNFDEAEPVFAPEDLPTDDGSVSPDQVPWEDTPEAREIAEAVREYETLDEPVQKSIGEALFSIGDPVGRARVWREVSQVRDGVSPRMAYDAALGLAQQHGSASTVILAQQVRRVLTLSGQVHGFCTEKIAFEPPTPGLHLCGAPLTDGVCPARSAHLAVVARGDRDRLLLQAQSCLHKAAQQQAYTHGSDAMFELVNALQDHVDRAIALLAEIEGSA